MAQQKATLIYVGDPMCSWCYGFAEEMSKVIDNRSENIEFKLMMGGLRPYSTETMGELGDFLKHHWGQVNERSNQPFNYGILTDTSFVYDTEPPSRAVLVMRQLMPVKEFEFFKAVQKAFYLDNQNTNKVETYLELAKDFGVAEEVFKTAFESETMKAAARAEFAEASAMGVRGFPSVLLKIGDDVTLLSNGYTTAERIESAAAALLRQEKE